MISLALGDVLYNFNDAVLMWRMGVDRADWSGEGAGEKDDGLKQRGSFF